MSCRGYFEARGQDVAKMARQLLQGISPVSSFANPRLLAVSFVSLAAITLVTWYLSKTSLIASQATKAQSHLAKRESVSIENHNGSHRKCTKNEAATMEISQLWVYPIKALRGCQISAATLTREGFGHDRKFVLLRDLEKTPPEFQHIAVTKYPAVCLFHTSIQGDTLTVSYQPPGGTSDNAKHLDIPLEPSNLQQLDKVAINMHFSPTIAYDLGQHYNQWFSDIFGFKVVLAYWGGNPRQVLGNLPGKASNVSSKPSSSIARILRQIPLIGSALVPEDWVIAFNDVAPFLVITEESAAEVTTRLPDDVEVDITKFRANIVLKNSLSPYDEDFWGELIFGEDAKIVLTGNCGRCISLNIDYSTGKFGTGKDGMMLKLLSKDRRVDQGCKYSPVFGRYGFASVKSQGKTLAVGDEVAVSKRNDKRTRFYWPGFST